MTTQKESRASGKSAAPTMSPFGKQDCATCGADVKAFSEAIAAAGLTPPGEIIPDGKLHRFGTNGKAGDDAGWYVLHLDGIPAGIFGDWRTGVEQTWRADTRRALTPEERAAQQAVIAMMKRLRDEERRKEHEEAAQRAASLWEAAGPAPDDHPYLTRKGIKPHGVRLNNGALLVPVFSDGGLCSVQTIETDGSKRFLRGGRVTGGRYTIGTIEGAPKLLICEGFATGASLHEATGLPVAVAFNAGNLEPVAKALRDKHPSLPLLVCGDDDWRTPGNPGRTKAEAAARAVGAEVAFPVFSGERGEGQTDFNDLHRAEGLEAVRRAVMAAAEPVEDWPDPLPLAAGIEPDAYPLDALPDTIRAAVEEVRAFVQAPVPLVASSALAALSLACQAHVDIQRASRLHGPVSLFLLTIADSGERKSTCDGFFTAAIRQYQEAQAEAAKPEVKRYLAERAAWEAKRDGILAAIKDASKKGKPTDKLQADLDELQRREPRPPRIPKMILCDETPEHLAWRLAHEWPSAGVISSEAGLIFGSHAMGRDSIMRTLALFNTLWGGEPHSVGRRTSESFEVRGARLTAGLMIQEDGLREFFAKSGALARGTGFLARFLIAWPKSTQGQRFYAEPPEHWPHLDAFHRRIAEVLARPAPMNDDGSLAPILLPMTPEAKAAWIEYHDAVERELASGGELYDVRDVAAKSADNAARLAALFHVFEHGLGPVGLDSFERASRIAAWHLSEARRFFGELALPAGLADAARLDSWLTEYCRREQTLHVGKNDALRYGPLRRKDRLEPAIQELAELARLQVRRDGKRVVLAINPALVASATATVATLATVGGGLVEKSSNSALVASATAPAARVATVATLATVGGGLGAKCSNCSKSSSSKPKERKNEQPAPWADDSPSTTSAKVANPAKTLTAQGTLWGNAPADDIIPAHGDEWEEVAI
jgi:putative DNA primase/helicase